MEHAPEPTAPDRPLEVYDRLLGALQRLAVDVDGSRDQGVRRRVRLALRAAIELGEQLGWTAEGDASNHEPFRQAISKLDQPPTS